MRHVVSPSDILKFEYSQLLASGKDANKNRKRLLSIMNGNKISFEVRSNWDTKIDKFYMIEKAIEFYNNL